METSKKILLQKLLRLIIDSNTHINQITKKSIEEHSSTFFQYLALDTIINNPNETVSTIAKKMNISISSTTQLIERLVKRSQVQKKHGKEDKRRVRLTLTQIGSEKHKELDKHLTEETSSLFKGLTDQELESLITIKQKILTNMKNLCSKNCSINKH